MEIYFKVLLSKEEAKVDKLEKHGMLFGLILDKSDLVVFEQSGRSLRMYRATRVEEDELYQI